MNNFEFLEIFTFNLPYFYGYVYALFYKNPFYSIVINMIFFDGVKCNLRMPF